MTVNRFPGMATLTNKTTNETNTCVFGDSCKPGRESLILPSSDDCRFALADFFRITPETVTSSVFDKCDFLEQTLSISTVKFTFLLGKKKSFSFRYFDLYKFFGLLFLT